MLIVTREGELNSGSSGLSKGADLKEINMVILQVKWINMNRKKVTVSNTFDALADEETKENNKREEKINSPNVQQTNKERTKNW